MKIHLLPREILLTRMWFVVTSFQIPALPFSTSFVRCRLLPSFSLHSIERSSHSSTKLLEDITAGKSCAIGDYRILRWISPYGFKPPPPPPFKGFLLTFISNSTNT
jgi:hypothetical protein